MSLQVLKEMQMAILRKSISMHHIGLIIFWKAFHLFKPDIKSHGKENAAHLA